MSESMRVTFAKRQTTPARRFVAWVFGLAFFGALVCGVSVASAFVLQGLIADAQLSVLPALLVPSFWQAFQLALSLNILAVLVAAVVKLFDK